MLMKKVLNTYESFVSKPNCKKMEMKFSKHINVYIGVCSRWRNVIEVTGLEMIAL